MSVCVDMYLVRLSAIQVSVCVDMYLVRLSAIQVSVCVDVYHLDNLKVTQKSVYFPESPSAFIFDVDVYNVASHTISPGYPNFAFKVRSI